MSDKKTTLSIILPNGEYFEQDFITFLDEKTKAELIVETIETVTEEIIEEETRNEVIEAVLNDKKYTIEFAAGDIVNIN